MAAFVDLHCHFIPSVDDGVKSDDEARELLRGLKSLGFGHVTATPHMRPGMFENSRDGLEEAYRGFLSRVPEAPDLPSISLASEHYFCEEVLERAMSGRALPYVKERELPAERERGTLLIEFHDLAPQSIIERQLFVLQSRGYIPLIAHPERYRAVWEDPARLDRLIELGSFALLDLGALVGKYGREAEKASKKMMDLGLYHAACSDAHRPKDLEAVEKGMVYVERHFGREELNFLLSSSTSALLAGSKPPSEPGA